MRIRLVFDEAVAAGVLDRPVEFVQRNVVGLPNGTYQAVESASTNWWPRDAW